MKKIIYLQDEKNIFQKYEYENISDLNEEFKKRNITIEYNARIGEWARIGVWARIGNSASIGVWSSIGKRASIGDRARIGDSASIEKYNSFFAVNIYDHPCGAWIEEKRGEIIQLGCFTRTRKEWENDFWNNEKEFPNDNSDNSNARLRAFKMCCNFLDLIKK